MHAMLRRALHQLLQRRLAIPPDLARLQSSIAAAWKADITYSKLARLPLTELKNALKVPCPTVANGSEDAQIAAFKRLRQNMTVDEASVCLKCSRSCPFRNVAFREMDVKAETTNKAALHDLLFFLIALSQRAEEEHSALRWGSAYKVVLALDPFLRELHFVSKEAFLFREVLKAQEEEERRLKARPGKEREAEEQARRALASRKIVL